MPNLNKVMLMGHLTRDNDLKYTPTGVAVLKNGLGTNEHWKDKDGNDQTKVMFIDLTLFGKQAETFAKYTKKGDPIYIEGRLQFDTWEKDGAKRSKHTVTVSNFQFLKGKPKDGGTEDMPMSDTPPADDSDIPF